MSGATYHFDVGDFSPSFGAFFGKWQFVDSENPIDQKRQFIQFSMGLRYRIQPKWVLQGNILRELLYNEFKAYNIILEKEVNFINQVVIWNATLNIIFYPFRKGEDT